MGVGKLQKGSIKRAQRARAFGCGQTCRPAVSILGAFLLFLGSLMPSWHQASATVPASSDVSQLQLLLGVPLEELEASICHHSDGNTSGLPAQNQSQPCKKCPLCMAFHHLPTVPHGGVESAEYGPSGPTPFLPYCSDLTHIREMMGQRRPRAPPLAERTCAVK